MNEFIWPIRVYYEDTDAGGIVHHASYVKFMERARTEWLRNSGVEMTQLKQQHALVLVVRKISLDYLKPAFLDDLLQVTASITKPGKVSMTIAQKVLRDEEVLCTGVVKIGGINVVSQRPQAFSPEILKFH
ncbi:tol-pal system-associated acyl-CoA thioesterase [Candidatus Parabeggiatoa sp. HSG14]|uniref:tol-pal system-associated acyl-CoA thioesterase n=1 Tax=Candidatus Parabeggiatoa sp. HSG14 TaxID=3055593 RepID=UPI0025A8B305|nr:tol-pal system-associated acyl-CoA thioesterase [Thiotrichales bacterium HSG14]